jgi:hypothetical protein
MFIIKNRNLSAYVESAKAGSGNLFEKEKKEKGQLKNRISAVNFFNKK